MEVYTKYVEEVPVDKGTVRGFHIYGDDRFLMTADLYQNCVSFYWPMTATDYKTFISAVTAFYQEGQSSSRLAPRSARCVVFVRSASGETTTREFLVTLPNLKESMKEKLVAGEVELRLLTFAAINLGDCRYWAEIDSVDGLGKATGIVIYSDLCDLVASFFLEVTSSARQLRDSLARALSNLYRKEKRGTYGVPQGL
jgi:hypothetical protein